MLVIDTDAEEVAGVEKAGDLAAAVGQQFVELERPLGQGEDAGRRVALVEQGLARRDPQGPAEIPELLETVAIEDSANGLVVPFVPKVPI